jgi:DNA-binding NarL/FixJ family response regulator
MIRVVVIDDHPALRAGLHTVLDAEPGIVFAGESDGSEESVWPLLNRTQPDLVLLDYHLPHGDGLQLCYRIKHQIPAPKVIVFSAYAGPSLTLPAELARADGLLDKGVPARDLFEAIRLVNRGERLIDPPSRAVPPPPPPPPPGVRSCSGTAPGRGVVRRVGARRVPEEDSSAGLHGGRGRHVAAVSPGG